jgi:ADP-heptose:LPS heptosyltransferase
VTRVLVARLDSAGDVLLAGPAVRAIAARPEVDEVVLLCGPQGAPAAELLPGADRVLVWSCPWIAGPDTPINDAMVATLRFLLEDAGLPDSAVLLTSFHQSPLPLALLLRLLGVRHIAGASVDYAGGLLDVRLTPGEDFPEDQPESERSLRIAEAAGYPLVTGADRALAVVQPPDVSELVGSGVDVVVHPGASVPSRAWPAERARGLVRLLTNRGLIVAVTGGPGERDLTAFVAGNTALDLGGRTDIHTLSGVLRSASVLVSGNTGPAHLAAAVGTPVVSLFSPVVRASRWAPHGVPVELLGDQHAACADTRARECPVPGHPCLSGVSAEDALNACLRLFDRACHGSVINASAAVRA